ncbi:MAG: hypothetical protein RIG82_10455 [Phycisphaeraceae bacterium]
MADRRRLTQACWAITCAASFTGSHTARAEFTTVIDVPPQSPNFNTTAESDTQVNVSSGGVLRQGFSAGLENGSSSNVEVNISGGLVENILTANSGSVINISGGTIRDFFTANAGSVVNITGGSFGDNVTARFGSTVNLYGGDFRLDGTPITALPFGVLPGGSTLTGALTDGSVFIFNSRVQPGRKDTFDFLTLNLIETPIPGVSDIIAPPDTIPQGLRGGQIMTFSDGTLPDNFAVVDATLNITGGQVERRLEATRSSVNISGGTGLRGIMAFRDSTWNISGGLIGDGINNFHAYAGSSIYITGGELLDSLDASDGSYVEISGGRTNLSTSFRSGSTARISGGTHLQLEAGDGSDIEIRGGRVYQLSNTTGQGLPTRPAIIGNNFLLNGQPVSGPVDVDGDDRITGVLSDGSVFYLDAYDLFRSSTGLKRVDLVQAAVPPASASTIIAPANPIPNGLRPGETLILEASAHAGDAFTVVDADLRIEGGAVGDYFRSVGSQVTLAEGAMEGRVTLLDQSHLAITGGSFSIIYAENSVITVSGEAIGRSLELKKSSATYSGGTMANDINMLDGSSLTFAGGVVRRIVAQNQAETIITGGVATLGLLISGGNDQSTSNAWIYGGDIGDSTELGLAAVETKSNMHISGGRFGRQFQTYAGSQLTLEGSIFELNGVAINAFPESLGPDDVFTTVLADGSVLVFTSRNDDLFMGQVNLQHLDADGTRTRPIVLPSDPTPDGVTPGQHLVLEKDGAIGRNYGALRGIIEVRGGSIGTGLELVDSELTLLDGEIGSAMKAYGGSSITLSGGVLPRSFSAYDSTQVIFTGGVGGDTSRTGEQQSIRFHAYPGTSVNIELLEAYLDGIPLDALLMDTPVLLETRDALLTGVLRDGEPFRFLLNSTLAGDDDFFSPNATLTLTLVPSPASASLGLLALGLLRRPRHDRTKT